jgi:hypothetical protein
MKKKSLAVILLLICGMAAPACAADTSRYSYIMVESVEIDLNNDQATVQVSYEIDDGIELVVVLLGKSDLKNKLETILAFDEISFQEVELDHAVLIIEDASFDYGDGSYWFPEHTFGIMIPKLTVKSPQTERTFEMTDEFPKGMGYFGAS